MSGSRPNHDDMLFEMLKECKTLPQFLDEIFGFLQRRTDFYSISDEPNAAVGLPEGLAENLVKHTFHKWKPHTSEMIYTGQEIPVSSEETVKIGDEIVNEVISTTKEPNANGDCSFSNSECYNGSRFDNYCWSQNITDIDIVIKIPEGVRKKDLEVKIQSSKISVKLHDGTFLLNGDLCQKCKANEAIWSLDTKKLLIHLSKCREMWWNCLLKSEPEIDVSKIDCSRPYEDLPAEAQAKIEELQWNQERKRLGLPTSEELILHDKLKKAWNVEGSPFKGPFDPSSVQIG
ncbi:nudC domain-containing protein 3 isoform X1 [Leptinotarsa decemlineata]|uniref:nudC domain-containing protein 3 isoform X1 n=1 Tax=Leptinotarsa decemlineata TaxID=7539 RepID=UPI003D3059BC